MYNYKIQMKVVAMGVALLAGCQIAQSASATYTVQVDGPDAIFLAGRTDLVVPPLYGSWALLRHGYAFADVTMESHPTFIPVAGGDVVQVYNPAVGGINFFNGYGPPYYGPEGNTASGSSITALGGLSGYIGTQGALAGVFLDNSVPSGGPPPATLNFSTPLSRDFTSLSPQLGQIFFIGDGVTSLNVFQSFVAPAGATRLFFGIPDAFGFNGAPGAYDDNDGSYKITVGVNTRPPSSVPDAGNTFGMMAGLLGLLFGAARRLTIKG